MNHKPGVTKKVNEIPENGIVVQNIVIRPVNRQSQDIGKWHNALKQAEAINGSRAALYDLYADIMLDGRLKNLVQKRILGVTKTKLKFVDKSGKEVPELCALVKTKQFRKLRKEMMLSKFWGISVVELMIKNGKFRVYSVPRKHIEPKEGKIVYEQHGISGILYRNPPYSKYLLEVGDYNDLGLILEACQYVIYKRGGFGDWAQFAETFGMPFREARYDGFNQAVKAQLEEALEKAGSAGYAILPREAEIKLHESSNKQGSAELFDMLRSACNEELAVLILGQTETTSKTAGKMGGNDDTHERTEDAINDDDREDELSILNEDVLPILANLGYKVEGGEFIHEPEKQKLTIKDQAEIIDIVKNKLAAPVDDDHIYETTGIPKPADYDQQKLLMEKKKEEEKKPAANPKKKVEDPEDDEEDDDAVSQLSKPSYFEMFKSWVTSFFEKAPGRF